VFEGCEDYVYQVYPCDYCKYELVDAIRVWSSNYEVGVRREASI